MVNTSERLRALVEPIVAGRDLELVDVEHAGRVVRVVVDRSGGVDLDALSDLTLDVSRILDETDPLPGSYTLEVSSPGLERPLRTPSHFRRAVGEQVRVDVVRDAPSERRVVGTVTAADDDGVTIESKDGDERRLQYDEIARARTLFEWGPAPKPGSGSRPGRQKKKAAPKT